MKRHTIISILLLSLISTHNTTQSFNIPAYTQTMLSKACLQITPENTLKAGIIAAGTGITVLLCHKAYTAYKNYSLKKRIIKEQYEKALDQCLPQLPLPPATIGKQKQPSPFDGITEDHIYTLFEAICFDNQKDTYAFNDSSSFERQVKEAYARIEIFRKHTFILNTRMAQLHAILSTKCIESLKAFALNRILERTNFLAPIPTAPAITSAPGLDILSYDINHTVRLLKNQYISAEECLATIIKQFDALPIETKKAAIEPSLEPIKNAATNIIRVKKNYREALTTIQAAIKKDPSYLHEKQIHLEQQKLEIERQAAEAKRQESLAIERQARATAAAAEAETQKAKAIDRQARAIEEQNRIETTRLLRSQPLVTSEQTAREEREQRYRIQQRR